MATGVRFGGHLKAPRLVYRVLPHSQLSPCEIQTKANWGKRYAREGAQLETEIQDRLAQAGVEVQEAGISHLACAPEIAATMLRRQQANVIIYHVLSYDESRHQAQLAREIADP